MRAAFCLFFAVVVAACGTPPAPAPAPNPAPASTPIASASAAPELSLEAARESAEARLSAFAERTTDPNARADALFRLATLLSEAAREKKDADLPRRLARPIRIQRQIVRDAPGYQHLFEVEYMLAHDLGDAGRFAEASQIFRSLVCRNLYAYPVPSEPADPDRDAIQPILQDHPHSFWETWERAHPTPMSVAKPSSNADAEERFRNPYPASCAQAAGSGKYDLSEIWLRIGDVDFDMLFPEAGPYALARAAAAYENGIAKSATAMQNTSHGMVDTVLRYKLAWTYYKQQRYRAAAIAFVAVLELHAGSDFDDEARTYLAGSLVEPDFIGPAPDEPYIARLSVMDTERDPRVVQKKMAIGLTRMQDPALVPQTAAWTPSANAALGREYRELNQLDNAIAAYERVVSTWPTSEVALAARYEAAACWAQLAIIEPARATAAKARSKTGFAAVVTEGSAGGAWYVANASNPHALTVAGTMVESAKAKTAAP